jgi:hypothetical protein
MPNDSPGSRRTNDEFDFDAPIARAAPPPVADAPAPPPIMGQIADAYDHRPPRRDWYVKTSLGMLIGILLSAALVMAGTVAGLLRWNDTEVSLKVNEKGEELSAALTRKLDDKQSELKHTVADISQRLASVETMSKDAQFLAFRVQNVIVESMPLTPDDSSEPFLTLERLARTGPEKDKVEQLKKKREKARVLLRNLRATPR